MDRIDRLTFVSYAGSAAIWAGGLGLTLQLHLLVVLPALVYLVAASATMAMHGTRRAIVLLGTWALAATITLVAVLPTLDDALAAVLGAIIATTLVVGAWALTGALLVHAKTGGHVR